MICVFCGSHIEAIMIGAGDGTGKKFAHPECYYRRLAAGRERKINNLIEHIVYLERNKLISKEVSVSFNKYILEDEI